MVTVIYRFLKESDFRTITFDNEEDAKVFINEPLADYDILEIDLNERRYA